MTVETPGWCGDAARLSDYWTCSIGGIGAVNITMSERTSVSNTQWWDQDDVVQVGYLSIGRNETLVLTLTFYSGEPLTDVTIWPRRYRDSVSQTVVGGSLILTVGPSVPFLFIAVNGHYDKPVMLKFNPVGLDTIPGGAIAYDSGSPPSGVTAGQTMYFPAGVYEIGDAGLGGGVPAWFTVENGATVIVQSGAFVIGSFDLRQSGGVKQQDIAFRGNGVVSGEYTDPAAIYALPFFTKLQWCTFYGDDGTNFDWHNITVEGLTVTRPPIYANANTLTNVSDCMFINPWHWGIGAFQTYLDDDGVSTVERCIALDMDDTFMFSGSTAGSMTRTDCYAITGAGVPFDIGYGFPLTHLSYVAGNINTLTNCGCVNFALNDPYAAPEPYPRFSAIFRYWSSGNESLTGQANIPVRITDFQVDGRLEVALIQLESLQDPFAGSGDYGRIANIHIDGLDVEFDPVVADNRPLIVFRGRDYQNYVHDISIKNFRIAGVQIDVRNFGPLSDITTYHDHISFGGRMVIFDVDICNMALAFIGNKARITGIDPVDGSAEATQCARYFPLAVRATLELQNWSFAKRKRSLTVINASSDDTDDPAWAYRYEIPDDFVRAISVLPEDAQNDYVVGDQRVGVDFDIKHSEDDGLQRFYTNQQDAWLRYIFYEDDPNQWSQLFIQAVAWHLASMLAGPIIKGAEGHNEAQRCLQRMGQYLGSAKEKDGMDRQATVTKRASWIAGR